MMGTLSRVLTRKLLPLFCKGTGSFVRLEPIYFSGASLSSSCVNYRRVLYGNLHEKNIHKEKVMSDDEDEDEEDLIPSNTGTSEYEKKKTSEYLSDGSDDESAEVDFNNVNFSYVTLPRDSRAARNEMLKCTLTSLKRDKNCIVKEFRKVKRIMEKGIMPEKIFFTQVSDIIDLNKDLGSIQLYKVYDADIPVGMQKRSRPPFFAIFKVEDLQQMPSEASAKSSWPVSIICDEIENQRHIIHILTAAAVCNSSRILFTTDISHFFHNYTFHDIYSQNSIDVEFSQSWSSIQKRFGGDTSVFVLLANLPRQGEMDIPMADLSEIDFWKKKEVVLLICSKLDELSWEFCMSRKAQLITIKEANKLFFRTFLSTGATTYAILSQYKEKMKSKSESKVMKFFNT